MVETVEYNGRVYRRYPNSKRRNHRVYYQCHDTSYEPPRYLHRDVWKDANGEIPKGHHIHHKDGNPLNNDLSNLECVSPLQHSQEHLEEFREHRKQWLQTPEGQRHLQECTERIRRVATDPTRKEQRSENSKRSWNNHQPDTYTCVVCGNEDATFRPEKSKYCSDACYLKDHYDKERYKEERTCAHCGKAFSTNKYHKVATCSYLCAARHRELRKQNGNGETYLYRGRIRIYPEYLPQDS